MRRVIIIGSGLAGYMLAKEFRKLDKVTPLMIITASDGTFYSKPLLSTAFTTKRDAAALATADALTMSQQLSAEIRTRVEVKEIDVDQQYIIVEGETIAYSKLVLALGSEVIRPPISGNAVADILSVNDLEDYANFREIIAGKKHIAILGAGLVGCEFANDLTNAGHQVEIIDPALFPLQRLLPQSVAHILHRAFAENGVYWHLGELVTAVNKVDDHYELIMGDRKLTVDVVLSAIGLRPNITLPQNSGISTRYGILVDRNLQTSAPHVYALGDCAEVNGLVLFFVAPLLNCAKALAQTLSSNPTEVIYPAMPVSIKTSLCPIVVSPPPKDLAGEWQVQGEGNDIKALFYDPNNQLQGFALTGKMVMEKNNLMKELPPLLR